MLNTAGHRIIISTGAAVAVATIMSAASAQADDQSYLNYLMSQGFQYHVNVETPARAISMGEGICTSLRFNGDPISRIDHKISESVNDVMVDAAQHELCPDTLNAPHQPLPERQRGG
jgi:hypothetical protein